MLSSLPSVIKVLLLMAVDTAAAVSPTSTTAMVPIGGAIYVAFAAAPNERSMKNFIKGGITALAYDQ